MQGRENNVTSGRSGSWRRMVATLVVVLLGVPACSTGESAGVLVVTSTSILGDLARQIIADTGSVEVLMPIGSDPHDFEPSAKQAALLVEADLVLVNGLGLEEGMNDLIEAVQDDGANVLIVGPLLDPLPLGDGPELDPHVWLDPVRMANAVMLVADGLDSIESASADDRVAWQANADAYRDALLAASVEMAEVLDDVPPDARKLVTNHDALGYFADRFGFEVIGVVIPGGSTLADPSSADLAALVTTIAGEGVPAIFAETIEPSTIADGIAAELGDRIEVVELFTGSLGGPGSGAETLVDMLMLDARRIAEALR